MRREVLQNGLILKDLQAKYPSIISLWRNKWNLHTNKSFYFQEQAPMVLYNTFKKLKNKIHKQHTSITKLFRLLGKLTQFIFHYHSFFSFLSWIGELDPWTLLSQSVCQPAPALCHKAIGFYHSFLEEITWRIRWKNLYRRRNLYSPPQTTKILLSGDHTASNEVIIHFQISQFPTESK